MSAAKHVALSDSLEATLDLKNPIKDPTKREVDLFRISPNALAP